ncbi:phosphoenolpyruvate carboxykinase [gtp]-related [Anaeramoeba flamelloides]|uniref:phosphoenolpyruvate carboxykinase (GTP) n=1 Tax=Anaeramoeba flamelloides TaxID=1746091 RepID=A0ABQ8YZ73_9EUKA|nr:phosphoenolpyruvate carboxykinase [gtp]-related [Anaeramoeba flamelloides]
MLKALQNLPILGNGLDKLAKINNKRVVNILYDAFKHMNPRDILILDDSPKDLEYVRQMALRAGEETKLSKNGHTVHYDSYGDQARDKKNTKVLMKYQEKTNGINSIDYYKGLHEMMDIMNGIMKDKTMIVSFYSLGPENSIFTRPALQITDSYYVTHSEQMLYRQGFKEFQKLKDPNEFYYFWHSQGYVDDKKVSVNLDKRRIYIDPYENRVFSANNQYAGNSLACKKLALRLAINEANNSDWLTEHMFIAGYSPVNGKRTTYFAGAYPSACGKTSTAMIPGSKIVGDDIAYLRINEAGKMVGCNIEQGVFGIIGGVNPEDDPEIFSAIESERELIFSNICYDEKKEAFWKDCGKENMPKEGINHYGQWKEGMTDGENNKVPISHKNSRFTLRISDLKNADKENLHNPDGVVISGIFYGGRDPDTNYPVSESLSWEHGVLMGAIIESETTFATLEKKVSIKPSIMAIGDFLIVPKGKYLQNHLKFGKRLKKAGNCPKIFSTNYFLKNEKGYLNTKLDKKVWVLWAEGRVHGDYEAIATPTGSIPKYEDLKTLFAQVFDGRVYTRKEYEEQFSLRVKKYLNKIKRMRKLYDPKIEKDIPIELYHELDRIEIQLKKLQKTKGDNISPFDL